MRDVADAEGAPAVPIGPSHLPAATPPARPPSAFPSDWQRAPLPSSWTGCARPRSARRRQRARSSRPPLRPRRRGPRLPREAQSPPPALCPPRHRGRPQSRSPPQSCSPRRQQLCVSSPKGLASSSISRTAARSVPPPTAAAKAPTAVLQAPCRRCPIARTAPPTASRAVQHTSQPPRGAPQPQGAHGSLSAPASPAVGHVANGRISPAPAVPPHRVAIAEPPLSHTVSLHDRRLWNHLGASSAARHAPGGPRRGGAHGAPPSLIPSAPPTSQPNGTNTSFATALCFTSQPRPPSSCLFIAPR